ncbi:peptidoglycan editing factor PgeF [Campylobacter sp. 9BO]|uniref:peptidoglycan editing factor PgeF n=1 Tax=Campylobacter sp. 9BO TaxID=3424759 RepID=UPI003D342186
MFEFKLNDKFVTAGFSDRFHGVSKSPYQSLNLGDHVGDKAENVAKNRKILANFIGAKKIKFMNQTHSDIVKILQHEDDEPKECDGVITSLKGLALCVMVADCSPVLIYDAPHQVIAALHAGRAGVMAKICTKAITMMQSVFDSRSKDLIVFVGPNIKGSCYEVGKLDLGDFERFKIGENFDMNAALKDEFSKLDIKNLYFDSTCTHCDNRYFSYRKDGTTGRFAGVIMLK